MKVLCLISGGKDSIYNIYKCIQYNHQPVALANLCPIDSSVDELDSYCFQTVGTQLVQDIAKCMQLPLYQSHIKQNTSINQNLQYTKQSDDDEIEELYRLVQHVIQKHPEITAVSSGAILSNYQRLRIENICQRLKLTSLAYLWQQDQSVLLQQMIDVGMDAILVKTATSVLSADKHCGKSITQLQSYLQKVNKTHGINVCGEGGEYETIVLDCSLYKHARIVIDTYDMVTDSVDPVSGDVNGYMKIKTWHLETKANTNTNINEQLQSLHIASIPPTADSEQDVPYNASTATTSASNSTSTSPTLPDTSSGEFTDNNDKSTIPPPDRMTRFDSDGTMSKRHKSEPKTDTDTTTPESLLETHKLVCSYSSGNYVFIVSALAAHAVTSLHEQLQIALRNIQNTLHEYNATVDDIYYVHLIVSDITKFKDINELYLQFFSTVNVASRACVQMDLPDCATVLVECSVYKSRLAQLPKQVLHVQSISEWAPACIGPYAQANTVDNIVYLAGQIGFVPATMELADDAATQLVNCISNCNAVLRATKSSYTHIISSVIYIEDHELTTNDSYQQLEQIINDSSISNKLYQPIYFGIPAMPRNGAVEVQLISVECHMPLPTDMNHKAIHLEAPADDYKLLVFATYSDDHYCSAWFTVRCNVSTDVVKQVPFSMTEHIVKSAALCAEHAGLTTLNLVQSRMYHVNALDTERLDSDLCGAWNSFFNSTICLAPYPVSSINGDDDIMVAFHFMFVKPDNNIDDNHEIDNPYNQAPDIYNSNAAVDTRHVPLDR